MRFRTDLRARKGAKHAVPIAATLLGLSSPALAEPAPVSLDVALTSVLALGQADGCSTAFGIPDQGGQLALDQFLVQLRDSGQLGREITAICGSSAVSSAAALGGNLGSLQTTKTVSQFRIARRRLDSRLDAQDQEKEKRSGSVRSIMLAAVGDPARSPISDTSALQPHSPTGFGIFGQAEYERRKRDASALEPGYKADIVGGVVGIDYATAGGIVFGAWAGYRDTDAGFRGSNLVVGRPELSSDPSLVADICRVGAGGGFDDRGGQFGGFLGTRVGKGFVDLAVQYSRRDYDYQRNICAIESATGPIERDPLSPSGFSVDGQRIDDVYAGTITGKTRLTEWSVSGRVGYDFGSERLLWGPRLSITYLKSRLDGFTENGRTSVTNRVESNNDLVLFTDRAAGDPTGLELAFDKQSRTSIQSEAQLVAAYRFDTQFGALVPRVSASWIHEFKGNRELIGVRMAQDLRAQPTRFSFTSDRVDKNKGVLAIGLTAVFTREFAADVEVARLVADDRFDSTTIRAQARWRF